MSYDVKPTCRGWEDHEFEEEYYGHRCKHCQLFYPHGQAPWDTPYCNRCGATMEEECACDEFADDDY